MSEDSEVPLLEDVSFSSRPPDANLLSLPVELFMKICSYLDAEFISETLSIVCQRFNEILSDNSVWRYWAHERIKGIYPALPTEKVWDGYEMHWESACINIDTEYKRWKNIDETMLHFVVKDILYAGLDALLLVNDARLCISGSRDRSLSLWNVEHLTNVFYAEGNPFLDRREPTTMVRNAHQGWIWDLAANSKKHTDILYSASWDHTVKAWDLNTNLRLIQTFPCTISALSVEATGDLVHAGLFSSKVLTFDMRSGEKAVSSYKVHKGSILAMNTCENVIVTGSDDKTIAVWDFRANKAIVEKISIFQPKCYPTCVNLKPNALYVGDSKGYVHLLDTKDYKPKASYEIWPLTSELEKSDKVIGIHQDLGSLIVSSAVQHIDILFPSHPPQPITKLRAYGKLLTKMEYEGGVLAVGSCDQSIEFRVPKEKFTVNLG